MAGNDIFLRSVPADADRDDVRLYDPTLADASAINGQVAQTIVDVTQSSTAQLLIKGQVAQTIGAVTQVSTGAEIIKGQVAQILADTTQTSTGQLVVAVNAVVAQTFAGVTQSATGIVSQPAVAIPIGGPSGGGPGLSWFNRKYRKQIRNTIEAVLDELGKTKDRRKRKRVVSKTRQKIRSDIEFEITEVPLSLVPLEDLRAELLVAIQTLEPIEGQIVGLMNEYRQKAILIDRKEEEAILAVLLLAA